MNILKTLHSVLFVTLALVARSACGDPPPVAPEKVATSYAQSLREAMGIKPANLDVLPELKESLKKLNHPDNMSLDRLAKAINAGGNVDALNAEITKRISLVDSFEFTKKPDWDYGQPKDLLAIARALLDQALSLQSDHPDQATQYARAAMVMAGATNLVFGNSGVEQVFLNMKGKSFARLAALSEAQEKDMNSLIDTYRKQVATSGQAILKLFDLEDRWLSATGLLENRDQMIASLNDSKPSLEMDTNDTYWTIQIAWELSNLARSRNDAKTVDAIHKFLETWQKSTNVPLTKSLLKEALDTAGPIPKSHVLREKKH